MIRLLALRFQAGEKFVLARFCHLDRCGGHKSQYRSRAKLKLNSLEGITLRFVLIATALAASALLPAAEIPQAGQMAPAVSLPSQDGNTVNLKDFHGRWVVLYFYPKDMT